MQNPENVLDYPSPKPPYQLANELDYGFNLFIVAVAIIAALSSIITPGAILFAALWNVLLGGYQLISALIGSLRGNTDKRAYLLAALAYLAVLITATWLLPDILDDDLGIVLAVIGYIVLPLLGATYYATLCNTAKTRTA